MERRGRSIDSAWDDDNVSLKSRPFDSAGKNLSEAGSWGSQQRALSREPHTAASGPIDHATRRMKSPERARHLVISHTSNPGHISMHETTRTAAFNPSTRTKFLHSPCLPYL
jgi:hypothetical protein